MEMIIGVTGRANYIRVSVFGKDPDKSLECAGYHGVMKAAGAVVYYLGKFKVTRITISAFEEDRDIPLRNKLIAKINLLGGFGKFAPKANIRWFTDRYDPAMYSEW